MIPIPGRRNQIALATKFGVARGKDGSWQGIKGSADYVKTACDVVAIPGTRRIERLEENWASQDLTLGTEHLDFLNSPIEGGVVGDRY